MEQRQERHVHLVLEYRRAPIQRVAEHRLGRVEFARHARVLSALSGKEERDLGFVGAGEDAASRAGRVLAAQHVRQLALELLLRAATTAMRCPKCARPAFAV